MNTVSSPDLSVIVIAFNGCTLLERCLSSLERQTRQENVEILVVIHEAVQTKHLETTHRRFRWIRAPRHYNVPQMRSLGIARCRGEIFALLEDDCIADENWFASLLTVHQATSATAIGGSVNPGPYTRCLDWAHYFSEYGRFLPPLRPGPTSTLPGTNVSYKRPFLLAGLGIQEDELESSLRDGFYETFVHQRLLQTGHKLMAEPSLVVYNVNSWKLAGVLGKCYHHGRGYAGMRVAGLPLLKRSRYVLLALLLPAVLTGRTVRQVLTRRTYRWKLVESLPGIVVISLSWSLGELVGYASGPGDSLARWR